MATKKAAPKSKSKSTRKGVSLYTGKHILLKCMNYFYYGKVLAVDDFCVTLSPCHVVFETGPFESTTFKDAQKISDEFCITLQSIESFGPVNPTVKGK